MKAGMLVAIVIKFSTVTLNSSGKQSNPADQKRKDLHCYKYFLIFNLNAPTSLAVTLQPSYRTGWPNIIRKKVRVNPNKLKGDWSPRTQTTSHKTIWQDYWQQQNDKYYGLMSPKNKPPCTEAVIRVAVIKAMLSSNSLSILDLYGV